MGREGDEATGEQGCGKADGVVVEYLDHHKRQHVSSLERKGLAGS
jgi:hypothetical protein